MDQVRIGILGAARIVPSALLSPARKVSEVAISAIAARNPQRAQAFARKHRIPKVFPTYEALIVDPALDAVYIPLPNGLHAQWAIRALEAGKHVLREKPFASNSAVLSGRRGARGCLGQGATLLATGRSLDVR